ncbi:MAG: hypothetical protein ACREIP_06575, partial [Alphaproteobacteria bacterium]
TETVKPPKTPLPGRDVAAERGRGAEAERALAAERLLREETERKLEEARAARAAAERKLEETQRALEELKRWSELDRKAAEERTLRAEAERRALDARRQKAELERNAEDDRRRQEEAQRRAGEERQAALDLLRRADAEQKAAEDRRAREHAEREAAAKRATAEERVARQEEERQARDASAKHAGKPHIDPDQGGPEEQAKSEDEGAAERAQRKADAERKTEAERTARNRAARSEDWYRSAAEAAAKVGAAWSFIETRDRDTEERRALTQAIFPGSDGAGIEIQFECAIGRNRRLKATARGFDRSSGARVPYRSEGEGAFRVKSRIRFDDNLPQDGLLFRDGDDDIVSIVEVPLTPEDVSLKSARAGAWLRHYTVAIEFNLMAGTVNATVAPYAVNLRRVLEACAE